ncbi:alpha/beta hydrolase fold domain-containing protein [Dietzia sp. 179-F 9C3 NHS]|uniref:alpha/beta hydrolase fold domain-containing protein n=1 Tax=Dietzia sp. 179-F 9C3 NHS TaxID=3374295 RepID=UPI003879C201
MPSLVSRLVPLYIRATGRQRLLADAARARRHLDEAPLRPESYGPPTRLRRDVRLERTDRGTWPVYTLTPRDIPARGTLVYVHGGAWAREIARQHWQLCARIAAEAGTRVEVPIYPLVPRGTAAEVVETVAALVEEARAEHGRVAVGGDSAGGQIALSAALTLRDRGAAPLDATVLLSPAVDLALDNPQIDLVQPSDPWLERPGTHVFIAAWRADLPLDDPRVSPLHGDFTGLGPLTITGGTRDICMPDTRLLVAAARAAGVEVDYREEPGQLHVHPLHPSREGRRAQEHIVRVLRAALTG